MKTKFLHLIAFVILFVTTISFQSCSDEKYTVWTDSISYSEFQSAFNTTLNDGYYTKVELTNAQWEQFAKSLTNEGKHRWNKETIKRRLMSNGFGEYEAIKESSWFSLIDHGFLATRTGDRVYTILK